MKYYDKNGNTHDSVLKSFISSMIGKKKEREPTTIEDPPKEVEESISIKKSIPKDIKIDIDNKKVSLVDDLGNVIIESDINPVLSKDNFRNSIDSMHKSISSIENIDTLLNSPKLIETINRLQSNDFKHDIIDKPLDKSIIDDIGLSSTDIKNMKDSIIKVIKNALPAIGKIIIKIIRKRFIK